MHTPNKNDSAVTWTIVADGVMRVDLGRPPANALGLEIVRGLQAAFDAADEAGDITIVVIASVVPGFFAAGADIKLMATVDSAGFEAYGDALRSAVERVASTNRITIAAIDGLALGGGLELALACTMRIGGAESQFGLPEVKLGLIPGAGGTQRLPRLVGRARALDIILTGRQVDATEAASIGLIDRLVESGGAVAAALELTTALRRSSMPALLAVVRVVDASADLPLAEGTLLERSEIRALFDDGDGREGIAAFIEKRRPRFS